MNESHPPQPSSPAPSPEELLIQKWVGVAQVAQNFCGMIQSWANSARNCLDLGDAVGFQRHIDMAEAAASNLVSMTASKVAWPEMLGKMRAAGSKPPVVTMVANVSRERGLVHGATWWGSIDANAALGQGITGPDSRAWVCLVLPLSPVDTQKVEAPKLVIAR